MPVCCCKMCCQATCGIFQVLNYVWIPLLIGGIVMVPVSFTVGGAPEDDAGQATGTGTLQQRQAGLIFGFGVAFLVLFGINTMIQAVNSKYVGCVRSFFPCAKDAEHVSRRTASVSPQRTQIV